jgi:hypothetical protein
MLALALRMSAFVAILASDRAIGAIGLSSQSFKTTRAARN